MSDGGGGDKAEGEEPPVIEAELVEEGEGVRAESGGRTFAASSSVRMFRFGSAGGAGADDPRSELQRRLRAAIAPAVLVLLCVWLGGGFLTFAATVAGLILSREWCRLLAPSDPREAFSNLVGGGIVRAAVRAPSFWMTLALAGAPLAATRGSPVFACLWLVACASVAAVLEWKHKTPRPEARRVAIFLVGGIVLALALVCWVALGNPALGGARGQLAWILFVVWSYDSAAWFGGKRFGGPKLLPAVSPGKTWSGTACGLVAGALVGGVLVGLLHGTSVGTPGFPRGFAAAVGIGIAAQVGDLLESAAKRVVDVKDAGTLLPGHGGLLDRVDGLAFALIAWQWLLLATT